MRNASKREEEGVKERPRKSQTAIYHQKLPDVCGGATPPSVHGLATLRPDEVFDLYPEIWLSITFHVRLIMIRNRI